MARKPEMTAEQAVNYIMSSLVIDQSVTLGNVLRNAVPGDLLNVLPAAKDKNDVIRTALTRIITPMQPDERRSFSWEEQAVISRRVKAEIAKICSEHDVSNSRTADV